MGAMFNYVIYLKPTDDSRGNTCTNARGVTSGDTRSVFFKD